MYIDLLPYICCPICRSALHPQLYEVDRGGDIRTATLACHTCRATYPVEQGIADFLGPPQPQTPAQIVNEWPLTAWAYERFWRPFALTLLMREPFPYRRELPLLVSLTQPSQSGLYVDIACSNGLYARALARATGPRSVVVGIDHSLPMLADARQRAERAGLRVSYLRAEAQRLPLVENCALGVVIGGSLNEIGDVDASLAEIHRVLRRGGRFVAMTLTRARTLIGRAIQQALAPGGITFWTASALAELFARHKLRVTQRQQYGIVVFTRSSS